MRALNRSRKVDDYSRASQQLHFSRLIFSTQHDAMYIHFDDDTAGPHQELAPPDQWLHAFFEEQWAMCRLILQ